MKPIRGASGIHVGFPGSELMLNVGALFLRMETELILKSRRVVPGRLLNGGFAFRFTAWPAAAKQLVEQWRRSSRRLKVSSELKNSEPTSS